MKILEKLILSFYYIVIVSITLLVALSSLYLIDLIFQLLPRGYNWIGKLVIYTYCGVILITLIIIMLKDINQKFDGFLDKWVKPSDFSVRYLNRGNKLKFYVKKSIISKWRKNDIKEIDICLIDGFDSPEKNLTLSRNNKWKKTTELSSNNRDDIQYKVTIRYCRQFKV